LDRMINRAVLSFSEMICPYFSKSPLSSGDMPEIIITIESPDLMMHIF